MLLRKTLSGRQFELYVDMHEDYDADGFYMCEAEKEGRLVGEEIVAAVGGVGALDTDDEDENEEPIGPGRYPVSDRWGVRCINLRLFSPRTAYDLAGDAVDDVAVRAASI